MLWERWSILLLGAGVQRQRVKVALPQVSYASEFLLVLRFAPLERPQNLRGQTDRVLVLIPGMISREHYCRLLSYLRFGSVNSQCQGERIVSRASSAGSG